MSRHKLVKTMNLDDELDNFDGGDNYDYNGDAGVEERTLVTFEFLHTESC